MGQYRFRWRIGETRSLDRFEAVPAKGERGDGLAERNVRFRQGMVHIHRQPVGDEPVAGFGQYAGAAGKPDMPKTEALLRLEVQKRTGFRRGGVTALCWVCRRSTRITGAREKPRF